MPKKTSRKQSVKEKIFVVTARAFDKGCSGNNATSKQPPATMSEPEKEILSMILPEAEPLPFPLHPLKMAYGPDAQEYAIPQDEKGEILKELYPFFPCPKMTEERFDIHEQKKFFVKDFRVIRERNRNMLVSPYYPNSGGMLVDWGPVEDEAADLPFESIIAKS